MSKDTSIEWADSTLNLMMGCDGCELWNPKSGVKHCYAGELTARYAGRKGYPRTFAEPTLFLDRLAPALKWSDLTGKERPEKPWLNGLPRMIFLNDMGDTFTESLPIDWLAPLLPRMADSPHVWMLLTKRGTRMAEFARQNALPKNIWPGVSVTRQSTVRRIQSLFEIESGGLKWISAEPLLGPLDWIDHFELDWCVIGGESGRGARACELEWIRSLMRGFVNENVPVFVKQLGSKQGAANCLSLADPKGGDPSEWPEDLRVRQMPSVELSAV